MLELGSARREAVQANGLRMSYLTWDPVAGAPDADRAVLLLHGFLDLGAGMVTLARALRAAGVGARLVAPDWRGHGDSGWIGEGGYYHFVDYVADLADFVPAVCGDVPPERRFLVGHSMGGSVAALYAGVFPDALAGLCAIEGLGPPAGQLDDTPLRMRTWIESVRRVRPLRERPAPLPSLEEAARRLRQNSPRLDEKDALALAEAATRVQGEGRVWKFDPLHRTPSALPFNLQQSQAVWRQVAVPVLLVDAADSPWRELPDLEARRACFRRRRTVLIPDSGHMVHHDAPVPLAEAIAKFIADVPDFP